MKLIVSFLFLALIVLSCQSQNPIETTANNQTELNKGGSWSLIGSLELYYLSNPQSLNYSLATDVASYKLRFTLLRDYLYDNPGGLNDEEVHVQVVSYCPNEVIVLDKIYTLPEGGVFYNFDETLFNPEGGCSYIVTVTMAPTWNLVVTADIYKQVLTYRDIRHQ